MTASTFVQISDAGCVCEGRWILSQTTTCAALCVHLTSSSSKNGGDIKTKPKSSTFAVIPRSDTILGLEDGPIFPLCVASRRVTSTLCRGVPVVHDQPSHSAPPRPLPYLFRWRQAPDGEHDEDPKHTSLRVGMYVR